MHTLLAVLSAYYTDVPASSPLPSGLQLFSPTDLCERSLSPPFWHVCDNKQSKMEFKRFVLCLKTVRTSDIY